MDSVKAFRLQHCAVEITPEEYAQMVSFLATRIRGRGLKEFVPPEIETQSRCSLCNEPFVYAPSRLPGVVKIPDGSYAHIVCAYEHGVQWEAKV
jgi:hypothetical protein